MKPVIAVPAITLLVYRAYSHKSLTPLGIFAAFVTAVVHALHPWSLPFVLLASFFLAGTRVTKIKQAEKARLTVQSTGGGNVAGPEIGSGGGGGGEGPRTHIQVLANSLCASILILIHLYTSRSSSSSTSSTVPNSSTLCFHKRDALPYALIANYAAVAADTFSSELGILSPTPPRLLTSWTFRSVPRGTNGGITLWGLGAGVLGAGIIALVTLSAAPFCEPGISQGDYHPRLRRLLGDGNADGWTLTDKLVLGLAITGWGAAGSLLDSALGGGFQHSVVDRRRGKVVEGAGGRKVLVRSSREGKETKRIDDGEGKGSSSRFVVSGLGWLDNNAVNFLMAAVMSAGAWAGVVWYYGT